MKAYFDRLREFAREQNLELVEAFEDVRAQVLAGRTAAAREALTRWRALLDRHVKWEEGEVLAAYERRCSPQDRYGARELVDEHRSIARMGADLTALLDGAVAGDAVSLRELVDDIDATLLEHRVREENEVCLALDHALDARTIERIEEACPELPEESLRKPAA